MIRQVLDGALYAFALPDGGWGALYPGSHIHTSEGRVDLPGEDVLGLVGTLFAGQMFMAGQGHDSGFAWLWAGRWRHLVPTALATHETFGVSPCAFGRGALYIATSGYSYDRIDLATGESTSHLADIGTQGIRYVDGTTPVSGDSTYRDGELFEWTRREDLTCGQGHEGGALLNGIELEPGDCRFIRFDRSQEKLGIGIVKLVERCAVLHFLSVAEVREKPPKEPPQQPPDVPGPIPAPIPPVVPVVPTQPHGGSMRVFLKLRGKYVGLEPKPSIRSSLMIPYVDRDHGGEWEAVELTKHGDTFDAKFVAADRQLSITPDGPQSRPSGADGPWETFYATAQPDGSSLLYRLQDGVLVAPVLQIEEAS